MFRLDNLLQAARSYAVRRDIHVAIAAAVGVVLGAYVVQSALFWDAYSPETSEQEQQYAAEVLEASEPVRIRIPELDITADFEAPLGLDAQQEIEVPEEYETVGWYKYGPTPGELGPAVVLGHVDSYEGPAVFYSLGELEPNDRIYIDRADGSTATFRVTRLERHPQSGFPTREVYGDIDHAGLRLITCSGTYDRGIQRYTHNLIVFAELESEAVEGGGDNVDDDFSGGSTSLPASVIGAAGEPNRTSSPTSILFDETYCTLIWLLLLGGMLFGWSAYEDKYRFGGTAFNAIFLRNAIFTGVYTVLLILLHILGFLGSIWWLFAGAWVIMAALDYRAHDALLPLYDTTYRAAFYGGMSVLFIFTSFLFGFPCEWWPFLITMVASGLFYIFNET